MEHFRLIPLEKLKKMTLEEKKLYYESMKTYKPPFLGFNYLPDLKEDKNLVKEELGLNDYVYQYADEIYAKILRHNGTNEINLNHLKVNLSSNNKDFDIGKVLIKFHKKSLPKGEDDDVNCYIAPESVSQGIYEINVIYKSNGEFIFTPEMNNLLRKGLIHELTHVLQLKSDKKGELNFKSKITSDAVYLFIQTPEYEYLKPFLYNIYYCIDFEINAFIAMIVSDYKNNKTPDLDKDKHYKKISKLKDFSYPQFKKDLFKDLKVINPDLTEEDFNQMLINFVSDFNNYYKIQFGKNVRTNINTYDVDKFFKSWEKKFHITHNYYNNKIKKAIILK
jgi:hypothetical protein